MKPLRKYTPQNKPRSNTGHVGISDLTVWLRSHGRPAKAYHAIVANWRDRTGLDKNGPGGRRRNQRFFYRDVKSREAQLKAAIQFRKRMVGTC